jgi:metal-responsive CopG/Arc/MetJ family transcriptional regulator
MKTAISIPDPIFQAAEEYAQEQGMSRSELYARAIEHYLQQHRYQGVTEALDQLYATDSSPLEPDLKAAQSKALNEEEAW